MKYIKSINEYRNQLEIPFGRNKHPLHDKPTHVHVLDAFLHMSKKVLTDIDDYKSTMTESDIRNKFKDKVILDDAFYKFKNSSDDESSIMTASTVFCRDTYIPTLNPEYYNEEVNDYIKSIEDTGETHLDVIEKFDMDYDVRPSLSDKGLIVFESEPTFTKLFKERLESSELLDTITNNMTDNNLIPIWRAVTYSKGDSVDTFENTVKYGGIGIYWSYNEHGAVAHNAKGGEEYIIHAYVKPEYINWGQTIYKSVYILRDEEEIELLHKAEVLVYKITDMDDRKLPLNNYLIINAGEKI